MRLLMFILFITSISSCESKSELHVNDLMTQLKNQKNKLESIDLNMLELAYNAFHYNVKNLNRCVDSFSLELGSTLNYYRGIKKIKPGEFAVKHHALGIKISNQLKQLEFLKKDIKSHVLPSDSISIYIGLEEKNVTNISLDFKSHYFDYQYVINSHDSLDPYFKGVITNSCDDLL